jgi:hypothetical protein
MLSALHGDSHIRAILSLLGAEKLGNASPPETKKTVLQLRLITGASYLLHKQIGYPAFLEKCRSEKCRLTISKIK